MAKHPAKPRRRATFDDEGLRTRLLRAQMRPTHARMLVLDLFDRGNRHVQSRSDIVNCVLAGDDPPSISTVFRTLLDLERHGLLSRIWTHDRTHILYARANTQVDSTTWLECSICQQLWPLENKDLHTALIQASESIGVRLSRQPTRIQIVCAACAPATSTDP